MTPGSCGDSSCTGFLICQNFEIATSGYDNSESWLEVTDGGTVEAAYTTSPLRGNQSLQIVGSAGRPRTAFNVDLPAEGEVYIHFLFKAPSVTPTNDTEILRIYRSGANTLAYVYIGGTNIDAGGQSKLVIFVNGDTYPNDYVRTTNALSAGTIYHIWVHYKKSTGSSDGVFSAEFTASGIRTPTGSGNAYIAVTNHNNTSNFYNLGPRVTTNNGFEVFYDQILAKTTPIGTVCE